MDYFEMQNDDYAPDAHGDDTPPTDYGLTPDEEAAIQAQADANANDPTTFELDTAPLDEKGKAEVRRLTRNAPELMNY